MRLNRNRSYILFNVCCLTFTNVKTNHLFKQKLTTKIKIKRKAFLILDKKYY